MVLGYFGKTPTKPNDEIVKLASEQLKLEPTTENPLDIADRDEKKSIKYWTQVLTDEGLDTTEENIFIAAACADKGIEFLKGEITANVRKIDLTSDVQPQKSDTKVNNSASVYTVILDGEKYNVQVAEGENIDITPANNVQKVQDTEPINNASEASGQGVKAPVNGVVVKIISNIGDKVSADQTVLVLESMKMEIEVKAGSDGLVASIDVTKGQNVEEGQAIFSLK